MLQPGDEAKVVKYPHPLKVLLDSSSVVEHSAVNGAAEGSNPSYPASLMEACQRWIIELVLKTKGL